MLKDNFSLITWLAMGATLQVLLSLVFPRSYAAFPVLLLLGWSIVDTYLMYFGVKKNVWYDGVIHGKWSVAYPDEGETTVVHGKPGDNGPGAVMILGTRSNSALGMFAYGKFRFPRTRPMSHANSRGANQDTRKSGTGSATCSCSLKTLGKSPAVSLYNLYLSSLISLDNAGNPSDPRCQTSWA